jgi:hypothetical protein
VARLAREGLTNREIGARLFIGFLRGYSALQGGEETDSCGAGQRAGIRRRGGSQCSDPQV